MFESKLDAMAREKVERTINAMLDAEADEIANAAGYERRTGRKAFRAGHYGRTLAAKAGKLSLKVPELKGALFGSAVIERCRRRESSVEEALMEMYLAGVGTRRVDDTGLLLWGGHVENVSVLVAIGVNAEGHREVIGVAEGMKEDSESWREFIKGMLARGLKGVRLVTGDRCAGLVAAVNELLPGARYQRCMVHFERNILAKVNPKNRDWAADALKAIFSMESRDKALEKAESVAKDMEARKLREAAKCLREGIGETTTYLLDDYPPPRASPPPPNEQHDRTAEPR